MQRRVFLVPVPTPTSGDMGPIQVLVTIDGDDVQVATRPNAWDTWSRPIVQAYADDDPADAIRRYPDGERTYPVEG